AVPWLGTDVRITVTPPTVQAKLVFSCVLSRVIVPCPGATANVTATCATGFPFASSTITEGGVLTAVPAVADWLVGLFAAIAAAEIGRASGRGGLGLSGGGVGVAVRGLVRGGRL